MILKRMNGYSVTEDCHWDEIYLANLGAEPWEYGSPLCSVKFYDEKNPQEYKIEFFNNKESNSWDVIDFNEFLKILEKIKEEFADIKKNQEKDT
jgi:hypothetical protein